MNLLKFKKIRFIFSELRRKKRLRFIQETNLYTAELEMDIMRLKDSLLNVMKENEHHKMIIMAYKKNELIQSKTD